MKCIQCQTDNTLKDRTDNNGRCKQCGHQFVFEPTTMSTTKVTDGMFAKAIADLSANNTLYFTANQLFHLLDKRLHGKSTFAGVASLILCGFLTVVTLIVFVLPNLSRGNVRALFIPGAINVFFLLVLLNQSTTRKASARSRRIAARCLQIQGIAIFVGGLLMSVELSSFILFVFAVVVGLLAVYLGRWQYRVQANTAQNPLIEWNQFQEWLTRWQSINPIATLLPPPQENALPVAINPDVTAYSFDRLVVTDRAAIAHLLIANNFHFENNCAILSITGYPQSIFQITMDMLQRNPKLEVFTFHDCSGRGVGLAHQLRTNPRWFANTAVEIFDVGLMPRQIISMPNAPIQHSLDSADAAKQLGSEIRQMFSLDELAWLDAGNIVLLESFTTQRLIQALHRGITGRPRFSGGSTVSSGDFIFVGDSSSHYTVDSTVDSFG